MSIAGAFGLNNLCSRVSLPSKGLHELNATPSFIFAKC